MNRVHIHEDDEGMRSLHPAHAIDDIHRDISASQEHAEKHRAPGGVGWTKVRAIQRPAVSFDVLDVEVGSLARSLEDILPRIREFEIGFGENNPFHYIQNDAYCYGLGPHLFIKVEEEAGKIESIWFEARPNNQDELVLFRKAIEAADRVQPLSIADYWLDMGGAVADQDFLDRYCDAIACTSFKRAPLLKPPEAPKTFGFKLSILRRLFGGK